MTEIPIILKKCINIMRGILSKHRVIVKSESKLL